jgi:hypothetical protein
MVRPAVRASPTIARTRKGSEVPISTVGTASVAKCITPAVQGEA